MYSRDYSETRSGTMKAFEDAFAKEEFLKKAAENSSSEQAVQTNSGCSTCTKNENGTLMQIHNEHQSEQKETGILGKLFSGKDSGDIILLLLVLFFLFDNDKENDTIIPILLAIILLF